MYTEINICTLGRHFRADFFKSGANMFLEVTELKTQSFMMYFIVDSKQLFCKSSGTPLARSKLHRNGDCPDENDHNDKI